VYQIIENLNNWFKFLYTDGNIIKTIFKRLQLLLCNSRISNGVMQTVSRKPISKQVPMATNTNTATEWLLEMVLSTQSVKSGYKEENWGDPVSCQLTVESWVLHRRQWWQNLSAWSWRISTVKSHCQGTVDEVTAVWKKAEQVLWSFLKCGD
jgi:hypothetical protein